MSEYDLKLKKTRSEKMERKHIKVVAAIIRKDGMIFTTQRGYGNYKDWWEFPGGKIEWVKRPKLR